MPSNQCNLNYILYIRKSSESEDRQMASIEDQKSVMLKFAKERGFRIIDIITESKSAKKPGRAGFEKMLEKLANREANGVLSWKLNRLARNSIDGGKIIHLLQEGIIQRVQTYNQAYKSIDNHLVMYLEFGVANQFVRDLSNDVRRGQQAKARRGWYPCSTLPPGYKHHVGHDQEIMPDSEKFPLIRQLWDLMLTGQYSLGTLVDQARILGLAGKMGKTISRSSIYRVLTNEFYAGTFSWPDFEGVLHRYAGKHKKMVTQAEFDRVQVILGTRGKPRQSGNVHDFRFRGPFRCGECRGHVTADHKLQVICTGCKTKFAAKRRSTCSKCGLDISQMENPSIIDKVYYHCTKRNGTCRQRSIEEKELASQVHEFLRSIIIPEEFANLIQRALKELGQADSTIHAEEKLKSQHKALSKKLDRLFDMRLDGEIGKESFEKRKAPLQKDLGQIERILSQSNEEQQVITDQSTRDLDNAISINSILENHDHDPIRSLLSEVCSNLEIKDKKALFYTKKPYSLFQELFRQPPSENDSFEPKKSVEKQGSGSHFEGGCSVWRSKLHELRTYYIQQYYGIKAD